MAVSVEASSPVSQGENREALNRRAKALKQGLIQEFVSMRKIQGTELGSEAGRVGQNLLDSKKLAQLQHTSYKTNQEAIRIKTEVFEKKLNNSVPPKMENKISSMPMVTLKDGTELPQPLVDTVLTNLREVRKTDYFAMWDIIEKCKRPGYAFGTNPFGDTVSTLRSYGLIDQQGSPHENTCAVVLNGTEGSGLSIRIVNPIKE